jgi:hypothetical protein
MVVKIDVRYPRCVSQNHKIIQLTLEVKTQLYYFMYIEQKVVTANNYMLRPLTGHHQVVHPKKRGWGCTIYTLYIVQPQPLFIRCTT